MEPEKMAVRRTGYDEAVAGMLDDGPDRVKYDWLLVRFGVDALELLRNTSSAIRAHVTRRRKRGQPVAEDHILLFAADFGLSRIEIADVRAAVLYHAKTTLAFWGVQDPAVEAWCQWCRKVVRKADHIEDACRNGRGRYRHP